VRWKAEEEADLSPREKHQNMKEDTTKARKAQESRYLEKNGKGSTNEGI